MPDTPSLTVQITAPDGQTILQTATLPLLDGTSVWCVSYHPSGQMLAAQEIVFTENTGTAVVSDQTATVKLLTVDSTFFTPRAEVVKFAL